MPTWMMRGGCTPRIIETKMEITYRDEVGTVTETVDSDGVSFCDGKAYFNDKAIEMTALISIKEV